MEPIWVDDDEIDTGRYVFIGDQLLSEEEAIKLRDSLNARYPPNHAK